MKFVSFWEYVKSKAVTLCFLAMGLLFMSFILAMTSVGLSAILLLFFGLSVIIMLWLLCGYLCEHGRIRRLEKLAETLPEKYLLGELLPPPENAVEYIYFDIMKEVSRSAVGAVQAATKERSDYCDYVESWIHEIKTPLTACTLILDNDGDKTKLRRELKRADNLTESILYFARAQAPQKDTKISEVHVRAVAQEAVQSQMSLLIAARIRVELLGDMTVYTDGKSLGFMIRQLLINCAQYCPGCCIRIKAEDGVLTVTDDGIGIPDYDIGRVTHKGFTGTNGRRLGGSTGMGLYIVRQLCSQLGIQLDIESEVGSYTRVSFGFLTKM